MESDKRVKITHVIFDVDGVFTTGQFLYTVEGKFAKIFGAHDNDGIKLIRDFVQVEAVSADARGFGITKKRINEDMKIKLNKVSENDRVNFFKQNYPLDTTVYMADGVHDIPVMRMVKYSIAPSNAYPLTKDVADYVTNLAAGEGCVLEACMHLAEKFIPQARTKLAVEVSQTISI